VNNSNGRSIKIEGYTADELIKLGDEQIENFALCNDPIAFRIGSAEVLGQFRIADETLVIELAQIDGGGEGVLPTLWSLVERYGSRRRLKKIEWIAHALNCAVPNLKLRRLLERKGFVIETVAGGVAAYHYVQNLSSDSR
jgi:hypothetical protein